MSIELCHHTYFFIGISQDIWINIEQEDREAKRQETKTGKERQLSNSLWQISCW
jgi:hypothetical protein